MLNIALFGPPGAGKGTQSEKLVKKYNLLYISTGDILRKEIASGSELGKRINEITSQGHLVSDELIMKIIHKTIEENPHVNGILFDGFPRTINQAGALKEMLAERGARVDAVVGLEVDEDELIDRLIKRGKESGRSDDNLETIKKRLQVYHSQTQPLRDYYMKEGTYLPIKGVGTVEGIFESIKAAIKEKCGK